MSRRGFSLLEVLVAGFLIASLLGGLGLAARLYERSLLKSGNRLAARHYAQLLLEECTSMGSEGVDALTDDALQQELVWRIGKDQSSLVEERMTFSGKVEVTRVADELKDIVVEVTYREQNEDRKLRVGTSLFWNE